MSEVPDADEVYLRAILDAVPSPMFVVDREARIADLNIAAWQEFGGSRELLRHRLCGDVLRCVNAQGGEERCGKAEPCASCAVRASLNVAIQGNLVARRKAEFTLLRHGRPVRLQLLVTAAPFECHGTRYALVILEDITELAELRRLVPICSNCKKIRHDSEYWEHVESYLRRHLDVELSHSICPECTKKLYPTL